MFKKIKKRDGRICDFDSKKITEAVFKAARATSEFDYEMAEKLTKEIVSLAESEIGDRVPTIEEIQDTVERSLMDAKFFRTAKAYILYRDQHMKIREIEARMSIGLVDEYLSKADWQVNENDMMGYALSGLHNHVYTEVCKIYWLNKVYPEEVRKAHLEGDFHLHDLYRLSTYCGGWDLFDLLVEGVKGASSKVESRPAKHLRTALGQIANFFLLLQEESAGAQAFSNFDTLLAPFIRYDNLSYEDVKQAIQEFFFNTNIPTRVGFQTAFSNVTLDLVVPSYYKDQAVIIGGVPQKETYKEFKKEMDVFNKALLEVLCEGDAKSAVFSFPIPTYNITKDFDWDNPNLDGLWEMTAKYGVPYFSNFVNSDMDPEDARSMCCRLRLDNRTLRKRGGGLFGSNPLTGSIGVVTLNLPRLGFLSKDESEFFERLNRLMELAKESLKIKRKVLEKYTELGLYPYARFYLRSVKERFDCYWKNHFSTIGIVGMNEACLNLIGKDLASFEGNQFTLKVLDFMRDKIIGFQEETGCLYNLEATPAEGTGYRLAIKDKKKYPSVLCANEDEFKEGAEPFYTNSSQLPLNYTEDIFEALDVQDEIQTKYTGGTVLHFFLGERIESGCVKNLVRKICSTYKLPYFTITPTFSICPSHGYLNGEVRECLKCGATTEVFSRTSGKLRPVSQWNKGKKQEFKNRKMFCVAKQESVDQETGDGRQETENRSVLGSGF